MMEHILITFLACFVIFLICYIGRMHQKIQRLHNDKDHDTLTGAYNRTGFIRRTEKIIQDCTVSDELCVLFFNIKGFKVINELFGVDAGDKVLRQSVELLQTSQLKPLLTARIEADHFVCLIRQSNLIYDELVNLCHRTYVMDDKQFNFYCRCGIYMVTDKTINVSSMFDRAKLAKEFILDDYAQPYAIYDNSMRDGFVAKNELTSELLRALKDNEVKVYYQPIYEAKTKKAVSAEALVCWENSQMGQLFPGQFIPILEENGYISELDLYIANHTTEFLHNRTAQGKFTIPVSLNLSRKDFYNTKMIDMLISNLRDTYLPVGYVCIEITESAYASLAEHNSEILNMIKKMGVKILLDDFGSGYSSFSAIQDFDFDIIKLDIGFTRQIGVNKNAEWIIQSIIDMSHHIGSKVIAEGVETQQQADFLVGMNCDYIQGYLYSKPLSQPEFENLLDRYQETIA